MSAYGLAVLAVFLAATFWGLAPVMTKIALKEILPFSLIFFRFLIASILLLPFIFKEKENLKKYFFKLFFYSFLPFLNIVFFVLGMRLTEAVISPVLYACTPILVILFSRLLFKEKISSSKILGILIGLIGILLVVLLPIMGGEGSKPGNIRGNLLIMVAVFSFAFFTLYGKPVLKKHSPLLTTYLSFLVVLLFSLPLAGLELIKDSSWLAAVSWQGWLGLFYLGTFATVGSYFLFQWAVKHSSPLEASLNFYFQPIVGSLAASLILKEKLTSLFLMGTLITLLGVFLTTTLSYVKNRKT